MLNTDNPPPTIGESYASAVSAGKTRVEPHRTGLPDVIAAAGMSPYRMGTALMRLTSEWQGGATPPAQEAPSVKELRRQGMSADLAEAESRRLAARCADWHLEEHKLRFQRLKTLPTIRTALLHWVRAKGWDCDPHMVVADTLRHFLSPVCPECLGRKRRVIPGTNRALGRLCKECRGTGEAKLEHGGRGRALLQYLRQCTGQAAHDMREGAHKLRRNPGNEEDRRQRKTRERIEELRRADAEAEADAGMNAESVAAGMASSIGRRPVFDRLVREIADHKDAHNDEPPAELVLTPAEWYELLADRRVADYVQEPARRFMGVPVVVKTEGE